MCKGSVRHHRIEVAQVVVENPTDPLRAQQGGIALDVGVQAALAQQVFADGADLVRRAAVHGREGDVVRHAGRDVQARRGRVVPREQFLHLPLLAGAILRAVQEPLHVGLADAGQVVTDAEVEHDAGAARKAQPVVEGVDQQPGPEVFVEGLVDLELLGPLDVVALVLHVDAGLGDLELVQGLDGLELDVAGPAQPGRDDVLGHLRMRAGGRAERCFQRVTEGLCPERITGIGHEEMPPGDAEYGIPRLEFPENPAEQAISGNWPEPVGQTTCLP